MAELETDADVGLAPRPVGLESDADVGLAPANDTLDGDVLSHTYQAVNALKNLTGIGTPTTDIPSVGSVMSAFGHEAKESFGAEKLGISDESWKILSDNGWFRKEGRDTYNPFGAFNELLASTVAGAGDILLRGGTAAFRGAQAAVFEATGSRDIAAVPEAFFGSPHPTGIPKTFPARVEPVREARPEITVDTPFTVDPRPTPVPDIPVARQLEVIGPERPEPTFKDSPSELADQAVPRSLSAAETPENMRGRPLGHEPGEYDARGKEWIDKIDASEDVRDVIEKIANDHDFFPEARGGEASEASRLAVAEAAGVDPALVDAGYFSRNFDTDGKVRAVIQALRQTSKDVADASDRMVKEPTVENAAGLAEAQMRNTHVLEYTMGLRAESGRSLAAWKDLLRETERNKAKVAIKAKEVVGEVPAGMADVVGAANEVQNNLKAEKKPGLQKLIDQAKALVDREDIPKVPGEAKPRSPEAQGLVDEAKKVLKRFGADKEAELESFRASLERLSSGSGKLGETVEAARELLKKDEKKPKAEVNAAEAQVKSERAKLTGAAKRLIAAADKVQAAAKEVADAGMQKLMETARQAVGRLKAGNVQAEITAFRDALNDKDPVRAAAAADRLIESQEKRAAGEPKPPVEFDQVLAAARRVSRAAVEDAAKAKEGLPPDIKNVLEGAKEAVSGLTKARESALGKLIDQAEKQAINMVKNKAVKKPVEALPPELQALVDKTERIVDSFGGIAKGERSALLLARTGRTIAEQEQLARSVAGLTPDQVAKVLEKVRSAEFQKPGWFYWGWMQGLISGVITHTGYAIVNTATVFVERSLAPALAAVVGKVRGENVSLMAPIYANVAFVHSLPDAFRAAGEAFRTGQRVPLKSEMKLFERGEESPQTKGAGSAFNMQTGPDWGIWEKVFNEDQLENAAKALGIPGRAANLMHTFFKVLSENASATSRAYEAAFAEGVKGDKFWERYKYHREFPTDEALKGAVNDAYTGAFMGRLGPKTEQWAHTIKNNPVGKWLFPFQHIPLNIERMTIEYTPFAALGPEMRAALKGEKGAPAQNLALAKMAIGSSVIGYFMHQYLTGNATSHYPTDPTERHKWDMLRMQSNSIKVGGQWIQLERLGPAGNVANIGAALGEVIHHYKDYDGPTDEAITSAMWVAFVAAANQVGNEVGFQTIRNLMDALTSEKKGQRFVDNMAGQFIPYSSLLSQQASIQDPYARKATDLLTTLKTKIPFVRETVLPKRDPINGEAVPNPRYLAFKSQGDIVVDPVKMELDRLKLYPTAPEDRIKGVKLPPAMYDRYQALAGPMVQHSLEMAINMPGWYDLSVFVQQEVLKGGIKTGRETAQKIMQVSNPQIINQGVKDKLDTLAGRKPAKKLRE